MSTLSDTVGSYGADQKLMADLANSCGIGSTEAAARAYAVALPTVLDGFSSTADMKVGATLLHTLAARLSRTERDHPGTLFAAVDHPLRRPVVDQVFGSALPSVQADIARAARLGTADRLIEITSLVCLSVAAGSGETAADIPAFVAAVGAAGTASMVPPPGASAPAADPPATPVPPISTPVTSAPEISTPPAPLAAAPVGAAFAAPSLGTAPVDVAPPLAAAPATTSAPIDPLGGDEDLSRWPWLVAAAAVAVLLIGAIAVLSGDDDSGDADVSRDTNATVEPSESESAIAAPATEAVQPLPTEPVASEPAATQPVTTQPPTTEPPTTVAVATEPEPEPEPASDGTAIDFASMAEDPDIEVVAIPMRDITDPDRDASGLLDASFNKATGEVCYGATSDGIAGPYSAHIHAGDAGVKGGIVVDLGKLESGASGCVENLPVDTNAILSDPAGHYAELHDTSEEWTVRGQLSETTASESESEDQPDGEEPPPEVTAQVDPNGGGAFIRLDRGTIYLEGAVADQATADRLADSLSNVDAGIPIDNHLVIDADAPLPSGRIVIADAIFFKSDSSQIREIGSATLVAITALAKSQPGAVLTVVGHTDNRGSEVGNLELSLRRATASRDLLVELGVPDDNLRIRGAGDTAPIADNGSLAGRELNRRIEFELAPPA